MKEKNYLMKCLRFKIEFIIVGFMVISCVPKIEQLAEETSGFIDKKLERSIAEEKMVGEFQNSTVEMGTRIGDREYIQNVFNDVFGPTAETLSSQFIIKSGSFLNGGCSQYEAAYTPSAGGVGSAHPIDNDRSNCNYSVMNGPVVGGENSVREGLRIQACEKLVNDTTALFYLIDNVTGVTNNPLSFTTNPTDLHITNIYNRFYPGRTIQLDVLDALKAIASNPSLLNSKDRFKLVALTVCMSADWQIP